MKFTLLLLIIFSLSLSAQEYQYVGSQKCKSCHLKNADGGQYVAWLKSQHSHAYWELKSEWALFLAHRREKYQDITEPTKEVRCLKCHTSIKEESQEKASETYNIEEGVGCETCHGPASVYINTHMKEDRTTLDDGGIKPTEEVCIKCHHDGSFVFSEMYPKIQHSFPTEDPKG